MIDIHCHILPGIDDGPDTLDQALDMARMALDNGITRLVATPHIRCGVYDNDKASIMEVVQSFRAALEEEAIPLPVAMAAEVAVSPEILPMIAEDRIPFLGEIDGYRLLLLELPHSQIPLGTDKLISWLLDQKIRPVIVHPERNSSVINDLSKLSPLVGMGCMLQITADSIAGKFGRQVEQRASEMLANGWVSVIASDAHDTKYRTIELEIGRRAAAAIVGEQMSWELVREQPNKMTQGLFD
ncbi:MAG: capsular biosynthesis protein [Gammaproteobacteria bacterium]|nr:capsular biosynthesis protein [Gammaproteobacteria bacterium]